MSAKNILGFIFNTIGQAYVKHNKLTEKTILPNGNAISVSIEIYNQAIKEKTEIKQQLTQTQQELKRFKKLWFLPFFYKR